MNCLPFSGSISKSTEWNNWEIDVCLRSFIFNQPRLGLHARLKIKVSAVCYRVTGYRQGMTYWWCNPLFILEPWAKSPIQTSVEPCVEISLDIFSF